ncbi:MAG: nucleotidyltransferase family protein [bacterium]
MQQFASVLSPEDRVLLCCTRLTLDEGSRQTLATLLHTTLDWEKLLNRSIAQGVTPLLYKHLRYKPEWWRGIPKFACDRLEKLYHHNVQRNGVLQRELEAVLAILHEADIPVMLMKELHLLQAIYVDPGLRPLGDLDLLVRREDFEAAKNLLGQAGYHPALRHNPYKERYGFGYHLINHEKNIWLDLQWNLCQREWQDAAGSGKFRPPIQQIWQRATVEQIGGNRVWKKSWEDLLWHLCVHAEGHYWGELIQFCDVAAVIQCCGRDLDWSYLATTATAAGLEASLYCTLRRVHEIWNVAIPEEAFQQLRPAYLPFEVYSATFDVLVMLYTFLDEAANDQALPPNALQGWECVARETAGQNHLAYAAITAALQRLSRAGFAPIACMNQEPERTWPHLRLHPLGEVVIIVASDAATNKNLEASLNAMDGNAIRFKLQQEPDRLKKILQTPVANTISGRQQFKKIFSVQRQQLNTVSIYPLADEEILLVLCQRFFRSTSWRDFSVLAEFLVDARHRLNWPVFWDLAQEQRLAHAAVMGLLYIHELTRLEIPAAAFAPMEVLPPPAISLYTVTSGEPFKPAELRNGVNAIIRFAVLPSWRERRQYLANFLRQLAPQSGMIRRLYLLTAKAAKFLTQWHRHRAEKASQDQPALLANAYWLETTQNAVENLPLPLASKIIQFEAESTELGKF